MDLQARWLKIGDIADTYQSRLIPGQFVAWIGRFMQLADLQAGEQVLDVACGTGLMTREAAKRVGDSGKVVGLDLSSGMLAVAQRETGAVANIEWLEASALAMPLENERFDVVLCHQGLQFFPDKLAGLGEMRRVLATGGRLVVGCWGAIDRSPGVAALEAAMRKHFGDDAASLLTNAVYRFSDEADLQKLIEAAGFTDVVVKQEMGETNFHSAEDFLDTHAYGTPLAQSFAAASPEAQAAVYADVLAALQGYPNDGGRFPVSNNLATARK